MIYAQNGDMILDAKNRTAIKSIHILHAISAVNKTNSYLHAMKSFACDDFSTTNYQWSICLYCILKGHYIA
jgi:hypothetical protein